MTPLRQHMMAALHRSGKGERTQESSLRDVRLLAQFYHTSPDRIAAQELQHYCLHRNNVDGLAPASMRICSSGIRFVYQHVLKRAWHTLSLLRAHTTHRLPAVRSVEEVTRLLTSATPWHNQVYCTTVSRVGLRLHAALFLQVADMDGQRLHSRARSLAAKAPRTVLSPCPPLRSHCCAPPGTPIGIPPGSFPPLGAITAAVLARPRPCVAPVSRAPSGAPNTVPA